MDSGAVCNPKDVIYQVGYDPVAQQFECIPGQESCAENTCKCDVEFVNS